MGTKSDPNFISCIIGYCAEFLTVFPVFLFGRTNIQWRYEPHHKKQEQQQKKTTNKQTNKKRLEIGAREDLRFLHKHRVGHKYTHKISSH